MTTLDNTLALHGEAMRLRVQRSELLASNLANADTPNYKARDLDFQGALRESYQTIKANDSFDLITTNGLHISDSYSTTEQYLYHRKASQPPIQGNTVDSVMEREEFSKNSIQYLISLQLISGQLRSLRGAIRGE